MPPSTPISGAQTLHPNDVKPSFPQPEYSEAVKKHINFRRQRMIAARDVRDMPRDEFDGMGFLQYYELLKRADDQYIAPRKNKIDTSINTGTIRDKDTTLVEYVSKYDFEPVAQCFDDEDQMMMDMAETAEDLVRKSFMLEERKDKQKLIARSQIAFGTALVEDLWLERWTIEKRIGTGTPTGSKQAYWDDHPVKVYEGCQIKLWDLRKCYFGDIRKFFMNGPQGQPYFFTVEYETYDVTKSIFGEFDMWKYVPTTVVYTPELATATSIYSSFWTLRPITNNFCEIVRYYDPIMNEYALMINGIDMLPIMEKTVTIKGEQKTLVSGFPLTEISPSGAIPFAKFDQEPMHDFAYSKSQPAKMRIWQDVENMMVKIFIQMFKQKAKPTLGNKSGRQFGSEATEPAQIINDIRDGDLFPILPNFQGANQADFSMFEMVKKELNKNSIEDSFQGINPSVSDETATKTLSDMKASSLKVAATMDGQISGWSQLFWLRTYNIQKNWTKPIDRKVDVLKKQLIDTYRSVSIPTQVSGGQKALKKVIFTKGTMGMTSEDVHQQELDAKKKGDGEVRYAYIHPEQFRSAKLNWFYSCVPVPNGNDPMSYMMFAKQIIDAQAFFGNDSLNVAKLKHKFASITGNDFDTWFLNEQELAQKQQQMMQAQQDQGGQGDKVAKGSSATAPGQSTKAQLASGGGSVVPKPSMAMTQ